MFPTLLILLRRNNTINILLLSYLATSIIIPVSELMGGHLLFPVYYSNPIYRFPEFIFGMACAKLMLDGFRIKFYFFVGAVSIFLLVVSFRNPGFMLYNFLVVPIIGIILMWLSQQQIKKNLITTSLIYLGEISYSFYLMQIAVLVIFDHFSPIFKNYDGLYIWVSMFLITLGSSHLCYKYIEKNRTMHNLIDIIAQRVGKVFDFKQA